MMYEVGSCWRKWDLHIHTPASHTAGYGSSEAAWERFLVEELAGLPPAFGVLGINDYIWVDGYARVLEAHKDGALPNIEAIFPVIELRLDDFVGTTSHLSKVTWLSIRGEPGHLKKVFPILSNRLCQLRGQLVRRIGFEQLLSRRAIHEPLLFARKRNKAKNSQTT